MACFWILRLVNLLMECSCMASLTPTVMVMSGLVSYPLFCMVFTIGSYLMCLCAMDWSGNTRGYEAF